MPSGQFLDPRHRRIQPGSHLRSALCRRTLSLTPALSSAPIATATLAGESCIPGIAASNLEAIFEEHVISGSLDPFSSVNNEFGLREKVFNLGAVVADLAEGSRGGVRANLKFINPIKVPCTVDFSIKPRGTFPPGACQDQGRVVALGSNVRL